MTPPRALTRLLPRAATLLLVAALAACGSSADAGSSSGVSGAASAGSGGGDTAATQSFTDDIGRTVTVPAHPQRIVALHDISAAPALLSTGAPLVGTVKRDGKFFQELQRYDISKVTDVGALGEQSVEKIASLDPDLIIGLAFDGKPTLPEAKDLSKMEAVAPTVMLDSDVSIDSFMAKIATLTGKQDEVAKQKATYEAARKDFDTRHADLKGKLSWAEVGYFSPTFYVMTPKHTSPLAQLANDIGLLYPPCPDKKTADASFCELSAETMKSADADLLLWADETGDPTKLTLWKDMAAVKAGKAFKLKEMTVGLNYPSFERAITDLDEVLGKADPKVFDESTWKTS